MGMFVILLLSIIPLSIGLSLIIFCVFAFDTDEVEQNVRTYDFEKTKMTFISKK